MNRYQIIERYKAAIFILKKAPTEAVDVSWRKFGGNLQELVLQIQTTQAHVPPVKSEKEYILQLLENESLFL